MPGFIDRNYDSPLDLARRSARPGARPPRRPSAASPRWSAVLRRRAPAADLQLPGHVRRARAYEALAIYAVITYMDTVNGVYVPEGGMHALPVAWPTAAEKAGASFRYGPRRPRSCCRGTAAPVTGVRLADGEVIDADAVVANPDLPVAYRTLLPGIPCRRGPARPLLAVRLVWHVGRRPASPPGRAPQHPLRPDWDGAFRALSTTASACPTRRCS